MLAVFLVSSALAFRPPSPSNAWPAEALPLEIEVDTASCPLPDGACLAAAEEAAAHWSGLLCTDGLRARAVAGGPASLGDGVNQLTFAAASATKPPLGVGTLQRRGDEVDFVVDAIPLATHADVLADACDEQFDLLGVTTRALGEMLALGEPRKGESPGTVKAFWTPRVCDAGRMVIAPPIPPGVFDFPVGIEVACGPEGTNGAVIGRAPFEVDCSVDTAFGNDSLYVPYDALAWDFDDGSSGSGADVEHTFEEGGVYQILVEGSVGGAVCTPLRGSLSQAVTVCPSIEPDLVTDLPVGRSIRVRNLSDLGPPGCQTDAQWTVHVGGDDSGPVVFESTAWSPLIEVPEPGVYTARVALLGEDGASAEDQVTFEVLGACGCRTGSPGGSLGAWLIALAVIRRRRAPRRLRRLR